MGIEPMASSLPRRCSTTELQRRSSQRAARIELATSAWKAEALPLCNARVVGRAGFEPAYSVSWTDLQSVAFNHSATYPYTAADRGTMPPRWLPRQPDLGITPLYWKAPSAEPFAPFAHRRN